MDYLSTCVNAKEMVASFLIDDLDDRCVQRRLQHISLARVSDIGDMEQRGISSPISVRV